MARPDEQRALGGTKAGRETGTFAEVVRSAFRAEGAARDEDIAKLLQVTPSALSQLFSKDPAKLQPKTVKGLLATLRSPGLRERVASSWKAAVFRSELEPVQAGLHQPLDAVRLADAAIQAMRPDEALVLLADTRHMPNFEPREKRLVLDRLYTVQFWLDDLEGAFDTALSLYSWGVESGDRERIASGLAQRARLLRLLTAPRASDTAARYQELRDLVAQGNPSPKPGHFSATKKVVAHDYRLQVVRHCEERSGHEDVLKGILREIQIEVAETDSAASKSNALRSEARVWLALRQPFKAEEMLEEALSIGTPSKHAGAYGAFLKAQIVASRGKLEEAEAIFEDLIGQCQRERRLLLKRLAAQRLSILRDRKFPPSHPV